MNKSLTHRRAVMLAAACALLFLGLLVWTAEAQQRTGPFTHAPRSVRSHKIDQQHVRLELAFDFEQQQIKGRAIHRLTLLEAASQIELDAVEMKIERVQGALEEGSAGSTASENKFQTRGQTLTIELGREVSIGSNVELTIDYMITKPKHGAHFVVPDEDEPSQPRMVWTQSEPEYARYWYPCFDAPGDRLTSEIVATVPGRLVTLSNGALASRQENSDGTTTWHWRQAKSHVPYLLSIVAGDFEVLDQQWDGIPVQSYVPRGRMGEAPRSFEKTPAMVEYFSRQIGYRYPWPKYAQICVDEYGWGGMEHTSATTLNLHTLHDEKAHQDITSDNLVSHELAHQWFGDMLTCKDWGEIWLNESFATYFATLWTEHDRGWDEAAWERRKEADAYMREDARYRRAIVNYRYDSPDNMFDGHSYPKGGRVLHMLRLELGDELFWRAIRRYVEVNQFRTVETADFRIAVEEATGRGMNWFFDQWLEHGGHPEFNVAWEWDSAAKQVRLTVKQTQKADELTPLFQTSAEIEIATGSEKTIRRVSISKAEETFHFDAAERPTRVVFDPRDWILKKLTFDKSKDELLDQLAHDEHPIARVQAVQGLASHSSERDAAAALISALKKDAFWGIRDEAAKALAKYSGDEVRAALISAAKDDAKSFVRRAALEALQNFAHDDVRAAVKQIIDSDSSYYAVAEALKCLVKIDRDHARPVLVAALARPSHDEVILRAACDGLADLKDTTAAAELAKMLDGSLTPQRKAVLIGALARLKSDDPQALDKLHRLLSNDRVSVRRAAIEAIIGSGNATSIDKLLARRDQEEIPGVLNAIDEAVGKLRERLQEPQALRKEVEELRKQNQQLEERLKKLEEKRSP